MRKLLMIAFYFPPSNAVGAQRTLRFARYLGELGWLPTILTVRERDLPDGDAGGPWMERVPAGVAVRRTRVVRPLRALVAMRDRARALLRRRAAGAPVRSAAGGAPPPAPQGTTWVQRWVDPWFTTPDGEIGWFPFALAAGLRMVLGDGADALYTTGPPHSTHLIGLGLKRLTGRRWIADFRDPWTRRPWLDERERRGVRYRTMQAMERMVVRGADRVILNTEPMAEDMRAAYPDVPGQRFAVVYNGYDPVNFPDATPRDRPDPEVFTIVHAGALYKRRDPTALIRAIAMLRDRGSIAPGGFRLRLIGSLEPQFGAEGLIERLDLGALVELVPPMPHDACVAELAVADVLLLVQPDTALQVPGKLFEYLYLGKRILALTGEGATSDLVRRYDLGVVAEPHGAETIADALASLVTEHGGGRRRPSRSAAALERFHGRELTGDLAALLDPDEDTA